MSDQTPDYSPPIVSTPDESNADFLLAETNEPEDNAPYNKFIESPKKDAEDCMTFLRNQIQSLDFMDN